MKSLLQVRNVATTNPSHNTLNSALRLEELPARLIEVAIIIAISILVYHTAKLIVKRIVARQIEEEDPLVRRLREQRVQTLGTMFTNVLLVTVIIISALIILSVFINITPLLASVSV